MKKLIFKFFLLLIFSITWLVNKVFSQSTKVNSSSIKELFILDTTVLAKEELKLYKDQLKSVIDNDFPNNLKENKYIPKSFSLNNKNYNYKNGDYYKSNDLKDSFFIAPLMPNIFEYREGENQKHAGKAYKIEFYNLKKKLFNSLNIDKINPYLNLKNIKWGFIDYAEEHRLAESDLIGNLMPNNYIYSQNNSYCYNDKIYVHFRLYSLIDKTVISCETTIVILDKFGKIFKKITLQHCVDNAYLTENGKNLIWGFGSGSENPIDLKYKPNGYFQVIDIDSKKILYEEIGSREITINAIGPEFGDIFGILVELNSKEDIQKYKYIDLKNNIIFEKNFSKDEYNSMLKRKFKPKEKLLNMYVFNNLKFKTK